MMNYLLTWLIVGPLHGMSIVCVLQFVGGHLQVEHLFIDLHIRPADVHLHLRVLFLGSQTVPSDPLAVAPSVSAVPAVLSHRLLPGANLGVLTEDAGQPGPESPGLLHLGDDVSHKVVQVGSGRRVWFPLHSTGELVNSEAKSLSLSHPRLPTILKYLEREKFNTTQRFFQLNCSSFSLQLRRIKLNTSFRQWFLYRSNFTA